MTTKFDFVLIIPFLNESLYINIFLKSLKKQEKIDKKKYLAIFIDNGSTDKTSLIIRSFCEKEKIPFKIINEPRKGTVFSRIKGLKVAIKLNPKLIISTDVDVNLPKNFLYKTVLDSENKKTDVLVGKLSKNKKISLFEKISSTKVYNTKKAVWNLEYSLFGPYFFGAYFAIKTEFIKKIKDLKAEIHEPFFGEDIYLSRRCYYSEAKFEKTSISVSPNPRRIIASSVKNVHKFIGNMIESHYKKWIIKNLVFSSLDNNQEKLIIKNLILDAGKRLTWLTVDAYLFWKKNQKNHLNAYESFKRSCVFFDINQLEFDEHKYNKNQIELFNFIYKKHMIKINNAVKLAITKTP